MRFVGIRPDPGLLSDWVRSDLNRSAPVQNQYQDRSVLYPLTNMGIIMAGGVDGDFSQTGRGCPIT